MEIWTSAEEGRVKRSKALEQLLMDPVVRPVFPNVAVDFTPLHLRALRRPLTAFEKCVLAVWKHYIGLREHMIGINQCFFYIYFIIKKSLHPHTPNHTHPLTSIRRKANTNIQHRETKNPIYLILSFYLRLYTHILSGMSQQSTLHNVILTFR